VTGDPTVSTTRVPLSRAPSSLRRPAHEELEVEDLEAGAARGAAGAVLHDALQRLEVQRVGPGGRRAGVGYRYSPGAWGWEDGGRGA